MVTPQSGQFLKADLQLKLQSLQSRLPVSSEMALGAKQSLRQRDLKSLVMHVALEKVTLLCLPRAMQDLPRASVKDENEMDMLQKASVVV